MKKQKKKLFSTLLALLLITNLSYANEKRDRDLEFRIKQAYGIMAAPQGANKALNLLDSKEEKKRMLGIDILLIKKYTYDVEKLLVGIMCLDPSKKVRLKATRALAKKGAPFLIMALEFEDIKANLTAQEQLCKMGDYAVPLVLKALLTNPSEQVQVSGLNVLKRMKKARAIIKVLVSRGKITKQTIKYFIEQSQHIYGDLQDQVEKHVIEAIREGVSLNLCDQDFSNIKKLLESQKTFKRFLLRLYIHVGIKQTDEIIDKYLTPNQDHGNDKKVKGILKDIGEIAVEAIPDVMQKTILLKNIIKNAQNYGEKVMIPLRDKFLNNTDWKKHQKCKQDITKADEYFNKLTILLASILSAEKENKKDIYKECFEYLVDQKTYNKRKFTSPQYFQRKFGQFKLFSRTKETLEHAYKYHEQILIDEFKD